MGARGDAFGCRLRCLEDTLRGRGSRKAPWLRAQARGKPHCQGVKAKTSSHTLRGPTSWGRQGVKPITSLGWLGSHGNPPPMAHAYGIGKGRGKPKNLLGLVPWPTRWEALAATLWFASGSALWLCGPRLACATTPPRGASRGRALCPVANLVVPRSVFAPRVRPSPLRAPLPEWPPPSAGEAQGTAFHSPGAAA